jgi:hypothetical protein
MRLACVGGTVGWRIGSEQVAKRKDSIALFEVIKNQRNEVNLNVPQWMGAKDSAGAGEPPPLPTAPTVQSAVQPAAPGALPGALSSAASRAWSRLASGAGGQLTLKLTYAHCLLAGAVLALVVIVSVWAAYRLGSASVPAGPAPNAPLTDRVPSGQYVVAGQGAAKSGSPAVAPVLAPTSVRVPGKYYLVIQEMVGATEADRAEAEQIAAWCIAHGEPATVAGHTVPRTGKTFPIVWSSRPFDSATSPEALDFGGKIEALGKTYKARYKRYDFRQQRNGKFDPWFEKYRLPAAAAKQ